MGRFTVAFSPVYGLRTIQDKKCLWAQLRTLLVNQLPWLVAGDFNSVLSSHDRVNGSVVTIYESQDFEMLLEDMELTEIKTTGNL